MKSVQVIDGITIPYRTIVGRRKSRLAWQARCSCGWKSPVVDASLLFAWHEVEMERDYHRFDCGKVAADAIA